jgi:hypothetical protein
MNPKQIIQNQKILLGEEITVEGIFFAEQNTSYIACSSESYEFNTKEALIIVDHEKIIKKCRGRVPPFIGGKFRYIYKVTAKGIVCNQENSNEKNVCLKDISYIELRTIDLYKSKSDDKEKIYKIDMEGKNKLKIIEQKISTIIDLDRAWNEDILITTLKNNQLIDDKSFLEKITWSSRKCIPTKVEGITIILDSNLPEAIEIQESNINTNHNNWNCQLPFFVKQMFAEIDDFWCNNIVLKLIDVLQTVDDYHLAGSDWINAHVLPRIMTDKYVIGNTESIRVRVDSFSDVNLLNDMVLLISNNFEDIISYPENSIQITGCIAASTLVDGNKSRTYMLNNLSCKIDMWKQFVELYECEIRQQIIIPLLADKDEPIIC